MFLKARVKPFWLLTAVSVLNYELNKTKSSKHAGFTQRTLGCSGAWIFLRSPKYISLFYGLVVYRETSYQRHIGLCCKTDWRRQSEGQYQKHCSPLVIVTELNDVFLDVSSSSMKDHLTWRLKYKKNVGCSPTEQKGLWKVYEVQYTKHWFPCNQPHNMLLSLWSWTNSFSKEHVQYGLRTVYKIFGGNMFCFYHWLYRRDGWKYCDITHCIVNLQAEHWSI